MKNRNTLIMSGLLALTLGLGLSGTAFAAQDFSKKSPGYSQSFDSEMAKIMTSGDYEAWKALVMSKTGKVDPLITKDNFAKFAEAWKLAKEGKIKEANAIRQELGLKATQTMRGLNQTNNSPKIKHQNIKKNKIKKLKKGIHSESTSSTSSTTKQ